MPLEEASPRKIASIGVHVSRWVTTHGYALNVDLDPAPFTDWITACGLEDAAFTTMANELGSRRRWATPDRPPSRRSKKSSTSTSRSCRRRTAPALAAAYPRLHGRPMTGWGIIPSIRVADIAHVLDFYVGRLGFSVEGDAQGSNVPVVRGDARLMVETAADFYGDSYNAAIRQRLGSVSPTALYMEAGGPRAAVPRSPGVGASIVDRSPIAPVGQAEFTVEDPTGNWLDLLEEANARGAMSLDIRPIPRAGGSATGRGCRGRRRSSRAGGGTFVAQAALAEHATIHRTPGARDTPIVVVPKARASRRSAVSAAAARGSAGALAEEQSSTALWTEGSTMTTLMIERLD